MIMKTLESDRNLHGRDRSLGARVSREGGEGSGGALYAI